MKLPKYRKLTTEELLPLEKEFVEFLVVSGITADEWIKLKEQDLDRTDEIISLFSDVVFESILIKTKYLEVRGVGFVYVYQCLPEHLVLVALESENDTELDFSNPSLVQDLVNMPPKGLKIYTNSKKYAGSREVELFKILESGGVITNDKLFITLSLALAANN